jgi:hypothetical protein
VTEVGEPDHRATGDFLGEFTDAWHRLVCVISSQDRHWGQGMLNDDDQPAPLRSFDLTNVADRASDGGAAGDGRPDDDDVERSDDSASGQ